MRLRDRLLISGAVGLAFVAVLVASLSQGDDGSCPGQPPVIERVSPGCGASALQLDVVSVDLVAGYEGELFINDQPVPVRVVPALNLIEYKPGSGREIERLEPQFNRARVVFWRSDLGRDQSASFSWSFRVN